MYLVRRTPHSDLGQSFERQMFRCVSCQKEIERSADKEGPSARLNEFLGNVRFWLKADIPSCTALALHMSALDPKQTFT